MRIPTALLAAATIFLSGCETVPPAPGYATPGMVTVATKPGQGTYLVGPNGMTLYILEGTRGTTGAIRCSGDCLRVWPPLLGGEPMVGPGIDPVKLTVIQGAAGPQLAYAGWPLYYYSRDRVPGDTTGQHVTDAWGTWHLLGPNGELLGPDRHGY